MTDKEKEFTRLVKDFKNEIYSVCYMFSKDKDEVADLYQDILIKIWNGFDSYRGEASVRTWLWRIALNACISDDRKKKRRGEKVPLSVDIDPFEDTDEKALQVKQLYSRINRLGLVDRSIVLLWLEALSYEEIGQIVGIPAKNVSVKLVRIRQQLMAMSNE